MKDKTFIKITNKEIYNTIQEFQRQNNISHQEIIKRLDKTNGKVKINYLLSRTALALSIIAISILTGINLFSIFR